MKPALVIAAVFACSLAAEAEPVTADWLQAEVDAAREEHGLIALGASVARVGEAPVTAVSGTTQKGTDTPVKPGDAWHIGSNTKALTALLYGRLVEDGLAEWGATLPELFPDLAGEMDPAWKDVTVEALFSHRSGIGGLGPIWLISRRSDERPLPEQRYETARDALTKPPAGEVDEFSYSNLNYIIAGAAMERILELPWETAMDAYIFHANDNRWSEGWGVGPPQEGIEGHVRNLFGWRQTSGRGGSADNPAALGPAGTLHVPLESHAELLLEFVDEESELVTPRIRGHLLAPWPDAESDYALGWGVIDDDRLGRIYSHSGSNTMWLSTVELLPAIDAVIVVDTNEFSDKSRLAVSGLVDTIEARLASRD